MNKLTNQMQSKHFRASNFAEESRRKMEMQQLWRPWDALPSAALVNVFCRIPIRDRFHNLSLVCKSWADACCHSQCWASMVADSHYYSKSSAIDDYAFLKDYYPYTRFFPDPFDGWRSSDSSCGVRRLQALLGRANGGDAVVSLYFFPFLTSISGFPNDDALLHLIAQR